MELHSPNIFFSFGFMSYEEVGIIKMTRSEDGNKRQKPQLTRS